MINIVKNPARRAPDEIHLQAFFVTNLAGLFALH